MSQVSKNKLNTKVYEKIFTLFPKFLYRMTSHGRQSDLIESFFTRTEKIVIAKRVAIAFMLSKGYSYRQISSKIKVSTSSIVKIADVISKNTAVVKELELIASEESFLDFLNTIGYNTAKLLPPRGGNWSAWRGRIEKEKRDLENPF
ncbi:MAG: Trp family transcriptional regulator [Microgenomates group bacterium]